MPANPQSSDSDPTPKSSRRIVKPSRLIPPASVVTPSHLIIEVEHGAVSAVYSSDPHVKVDILDRDAVAVGNVKAKDLKPLEAATTSLHQVF